MWPFAKKPAGEDSRTGGDAWLVVGLGNPGRKYASTRHNAGAMVLEALTRRAHGNFGVMSKSPKHRGLIAQGRIGRSKVILLFPQTFMNLSGESVQAAANFFKIPPNRILLVFDDKDIPLGQLRLRPEGGAGGHNGVKSVIQQLGTQSFPRLRVGIGSPQADRANDTADFVLGRPNKEEQAQMEEAVSRAAAATETIIREGLDPAMNQFN